MRLAAVTVLVGVAACTEPAIEVHLSLPAEAQDFDYSCIGSVDVLPIPRGDKNTLDIGQRITTLGQNVPCIDLATPPSSLADFAAELHGRLDVPIPTEGLAGMELRARAGACSDDPFKESILYGGGVYDGSSKQLNVAVAHNISCSSATMYTLRPFDLFALLDTHTCTPVTAGNVYAADVRPTKLDALDYPRLFEYGPGQAQLTDTVAAAKIPSYSGSYAGTCLGAEYESTDLTQFGMTCTISEAPLCGDPGDIEIPVVSGIYISNTLDALNPMVQGPSDAPILVAVLTTAADGSKVPVQGATITVDEGANATVFYGDRGDPQTQTFALAQGATATTADGLAVVFPVGIAGVTVTAPGHTTQKAYLGSGDYIGATAVIVLN